MHPLLFAAGTFAIWAGIIACGVYVDGKPGGAMIAIGSILGAVWLLIGYSAVSAVRRLSAGA